MIVVSDTSPLNYLILIAHAHLLEELYRRIIIPQAVWRELQIAGAPAQVQEWVAHVPGWVEIHEVPDPDPTLRLDPGEQEAITLAERLKADVILLDERRGRDAARERGLAIIGTLGVLEAAAEAGRIDLRAAIARLQQTSFRAPSALLNEMLERDMRRR
jgi:predicted nucleic acid-binding protein